jgi:hypothetical protein
LAVDEESSDVVFGALYLLNYEPNNTIMKNKNFKKMILLIREIE